MQDRIVSDPDVCSGKPVIRGTRVMVRNILSALGGGESREAILRSYPSLTSQDIEAAIHYAIGLVDDVRLISRAA